MNNNGMVKKPMPRNGTVVAPPIVNAVPPEVKQQKAESAIRGESEYKS